MNADRHDITVRPADPEDLGQIHSIGQECNRSPWSYAGLQSELSNPNSIFLAATPVQNGNVIGFVCAALILDELQINNIAVHPNLQGKGIGTALIKRILAEASTKGAKRAYLEVRASNTRAIKTYEKCGFVGNGIRKGYYRDGENAVLMSTIIHFENKKAPIL